MVMQVHSVNLVPAGIGRYTGANAVVLLTDTPSDSASGGVALPADKRVTDANDMRTVDSCDLYVTGGGTVTITYDGDTPTASYGFPLSDFESYRKINRSDLAAMKFFVPMNSTLHVRYFWGHL